MKNGKKRWPGRNEDVFYQAVLSRDYRFDGKFFTGVKTTGIYCRPICPAKPLRKNVEFFPDALSAERAGYRPCLRCRPESSPRSPAWMGKSSTVQRALKLVANGKLGSSEDRFASKLGVSARHLRRLFEAELGRTPKQIANLTRLDFSRKLVTETGIPITEIALGSGFSSIRRFNDAFKKRFNRAPSLLRRHHSVDHELINLTLAFRPPFDWASLLDFYRAHEIFGIEFTSANSYQRVFKLGRTIGGFTVEPNDNKSVSLKIKNCDAKDILLVTQKVRQMFDLDSDPLLITNAFSDCKIMSKLCIKFPGLRLPIGWDPFETSICSILGQLVSVKQTRSLVKQLVEQYGEKIENPFTGDDAYLFPTPKVLAAGSLSKINTSQSRRQTIKDFSRLVMEGKLSLESTQDPAEFRKAILNVRGIGVWTAEYIALRALGDTDAFPREDWVIKKALQSQPGIKLDSFRPWRGYSALYLWKEQRSNNGKKL